MRESRSYWINHYFVGKAVIPFDSPPVNAVLPYFGRTVDFFDGKPGRMSPDKTVFSESTLCKIVVLRFYVDIDLTNKLVIPVERRRFFFFRNARRVRDKTIVQVISAVFFQIGVRHGGAVIGATLPTHIRGRLEIEVRMPGEAEFVETYAVQRYVRIKSKQIPHRPTERLAPKIREVQNRI